MTRRLSFWGWGWEDRFPAPSARKFIGHQVGQLIGVTPETMLEPPTIDGIRLPEPRLQAPTHLADHAAADPHSRASHTYGKNFRDQVRGLAGNFEPAPDFVLNATEERHVTELLDWAGDHNVAVIPFGGGTSVVGGVEADFSTRDDNPYAGVVSLDLRGLDQVLEVDPISRAARIQAGATGPGLEAQLKPHGLTLRHFPQSFEFSTLGGWIATRAGGHFATLYTHIDDLVESTRTVTPAGLLETRRLPGSGAGPSPDRLMLGSEGTLGVITEAWVRVQSKPTFRAAATVRFEDFQHGVLAARMIAQAGLYPANCRLLDRREAKLNQVTSDGSHVLLIAFESADHDVTPWLDRALAIAKGCGGRCPEAPASRRGEEGARSATRWRDAFLAMPYLQSALVTLGLVVDTFETACTWDRFFELHEAIHDAVHDAMRRVCGSGSLTCRFTHVYPDGPAPYYTFMAPGREGARLEQWAAIKAAASDAIIAHGGTITHHHAVGRLHRPWYDKQRPEPFALALQAAKSALDPAGVLNPGALIDRSFKV